MTGEQDRVGLHQHVERALGIADGKRAGHPSDYLEQLSAAIVYLDRTQLQRAAQRLIEAEGGWYCLSNGACPGERWQAPQ